jgi:hypothetical protein
MYFPLIRLEKEMCMNEAMKSIKLNGAESSCGLGGPRCLRLYISVLESAAQAQKVLSA